MKSRYLMLASVAGSLLAAPAAFAQYLSPENIHDHYVPSVNSTSTQYLSPNESNAPTIAPQPMGQPVYNSPQTTYAPAPTTVPPSAPPPSYTPPPLAPAPYGTTPPAPPPPPRPGMAPYNSGMTPPPPPAPPYGSPSYNQQPYGNPSYNQPLGQPAMSPPAPRGGESAENLSDGPTSANPELYVTGGVADEGMEQIRAIENQYSLKVLYAGKDGSYYATVNTKITDSKGNTVIDTSTDGPVLLAKLKPGTYKIHAEKDGVTKTVSANVGKGLRNVKIIF